MKPSEAKRKYQQKKRNRCYIHNQSESEEEVEEEEEEEEAYEVTIKKKLYYTTNEIDGIIYSIDNDDEIGDEVGHFKNGKPVFNKKKQTIMQLHI